MTDDALIELLIAGDHTRTGPGPHLSPEFLRELVAFVTRYARLEKMLAGGTRVAYSPSALGLNLSISGDILGQAEDLARLERVRFKLPNGPILDIDQLIEAQGVKVVPCRFPVGTAASGGFFFDAELGPCIFHDAALTIPQRDYVVAHQYGHFLADFEPYIHTVCGHPNPALVEDMREVRAHQFALAFLMPRVDVEAYQKAIGLELGNEIPREFVQQLQVYFAVDNEVVLWRLLSLGWTDAAGIATLLSKDGGLLPEIDLEQIDREARLVYSKPIPERFIHLVASAFGRGMLDLEDAAEFLGTDLNEAQSVLEQFHFEDPAAKEPPPKAAEQSSGADPSLN